MARPCLWSPNASRRGAALPPTIGDSNAEQAQDSSLTRGAGDLADRAFVAIGGVAGALPGKNTVNSGDVKKNSLKSIDLKNDGVTGADVKESTLEIPAGAVTKTTFGISANADGTVAATTLPGTTVTASGGGAYTVRFPRSVQGCVPVASDDSVPTVAVRTNKPPNPGQENQVFVTFSDSLNSDFNLIVTCP